MRKLSHTSEDIARNLYRCSCDRSCWTNQWKQQLKRARLVARCDDVIRRETAHVRPYQSAQVSRLIQNASWRNFMLIRIFRFIKEKVHQKITQHTLMSVWNVMEQSMDIWKSHRWSNIHFCRLIKTRVTAFPKRSFAFERFLDKCDSLEKWHFAWNPSFEVILLIYFNTWLSWEKNRAVRC